VPWLPLLIGKGQDDNGFRRILAHTRVSVTDVSILSQVEGEGKETEGEGQGMFKVRYKDFA
jgi:hypothetical protein